MILMTPPPYRTAPLLPRLISMRSMLSRGIVLKSTPRRSKSTPIKEKECVRRCRRAKAAEIDRRGGTIGTASGAPRLHADFARQHILNCQTGRACDFIGRDDARGCSDDSRASTARPHVDSGQYLRCALRTSRGYEARERGECAAKLCSKSHDTRSFVFVRARERIG